MEAHRNRKNAALGNYHLSFSIYNRYYVGYPPTFSPQQFEETQPRHTELGQDQSYTPEKLRMMYCMMWSYSVMEERFP